jgi:hypothetical protein
MSSRLSKMTDPLDPLLCGHTVLPAAVPDDNTSSCAAAGEILARRSDGGAAVFLAAVWVMMATANPEGMRRRAELEDEGRYTVLILSLVAAIAILLTSCSCSMASRICPQTWLASMLRWQLELSCCRGFS